MNTTEEEMSITEFLDEVYRLCAQNEHKATDLVMNFMDDNQLSGQFDVCDAAFAAADPARLEASVIIGFLGITLRAAREGRLPSREGFIDRAVVALKRLPDGDKLAKTLMKYVERTR